MATTPRGFRDILPDEAEMREHVVATVKARLSRHGYRPIGTPLIESMNTAEKNAWNSDAPFNLFDDNGHCSPYDRTTPPRWSTPSLRA